MEHLLIQAYSDEKFRSKHGGQITVLLNPESVKTGKGIRYREDKQQGAVGKNNVFERYDSETFSFNFTIDCTGVVEGTQKGDTATAKVKEIEDSIYCYNSELHRPSFRDALQSSATVDWAAKTASAPPVWVGYALQFLATFLPTLLMEGLILLLFQYRQKRSWAVFGVTNLVTQGALAATLSINVIRHGAGFGFLLLFAAAEFAVLVVEAVAYVVLLKERSRKTAVFYALAANAVSAGVGWLISEPVWRFVVSIS